jgi:hypothetical protein
MPTMSDYGWPAVLVAVLGILATVIGALLAGRRKREERIDEVKSEREQSVADGDLDLEHLDRERLERMRK